MPRQSRLYFYAVREDLEPVFRAVEAGRALKYVQSGAFDSPEPPTYRSGLELPDLGVARTGDSVQATAFLVMFFPAEVAVREVHLYRGGTRYMFSQLECPQSLVLRPAGAYDGCIIRGDCETAYDNSESRVLFRAFAAAFRKQFTRVAGEWVGPEALRRFQAGTRLTCDAQVRMFDLKAEPASGVSALARREEPQ
jgi:hypothetical protein